jgi:hypothetical protein
MLANFLYNNSSTPLLQVPFEQNHQQIFEDSSYCCNVLTENQRTLQLHLGNPSSIGIILALILTPQDILALYHILTTST